MIYLLLSVMNKILVFLSKKKKSITSKLCILSFKQEHKNREKKKDLREKKYLRYYWTCLKLHSVLFIQHPITTSMRLDSKRVWRLRPNLSPVHCSWDPQTSFFSKIFIKNESHGTIHIFKNYFAIVFSVFSNKWYLNRTLISYLPNKYLF